MIPEPLSAPSSRVRPLLLGRARRGLRAASAAGALGLAATVLAGCGAGQNATVYQVTAPYDGTRATVGDLVINNTVMVVSDSGEATLLAAIYNGGAQDDKLTAVTSDKGQVQLSGDTTVPGSGGQLELGLPQGSSTSGATHGTATIASPQFKAGQTVKITLQFERAGNVSYSAIVYPAKDYYATVAPSGAASPSSTESMTPMSTPSSSTSLSATPTSAPISSTKSS